MSRNATRVKHALACAALAVARVGARFATAAAGNVQDGDVAKLAEGVLTPVADGATRLIVELPEGSASAPVDVAAAAATRPVSFRLDVMPIFARNGCNQGSCHGSARGQDGFRLSLFGFDPEGDHFRLTREVGTRRINLALPEQSLVVQKALGNVTHTG